MSDKPKDENLTDIINATGDGVTPPVSVTIEGELPTGDGDGNTYKKKPRAKKTAVPKDTTFENFANGAPMAKLTEEEKLIYVKALATGERCEFEIVPEGRGIYAVPVTVRAKTVADMRVLAHAIRTLPHTDFATPEATLLAYTATCQVVKIGNRVVEPFTGRLPVTDEQAQALRDRADALFANLTLPAFNYAIAACKLFEEKMEAAAFGALNENFFSLRGFESSTKR